MDTRFKNFQLERKRECASAEYLWRMTVHILRNREDNVLKFFHPSNNNMLFKLPLKVDTDYKNLKDELLNTDWYEFVRQQRPSTKWLVEKIICIRFDIYKL